MYHAAGNDAVEKMNKILKQILTMYVDTKHENWDEYLQAAISAYYTSPHASSGFSPYEANFGRVPVTLTDVMLDPQPVEQVNEKLNDYVSRIRSNAEVINRKINENLNEAHKSNMTDL